MEAPDWIPAKNPRISVGEIFIKDASFEAPHSPEIFRRMNTSWRPIVTPKYHISANKNEDGWYEIVLYLSVTTTLEEDTAYVVDVQQAGLFLFQQVEEDDIHKLVGSYCPRYLFPFAREAVANLVQKSGFRQLSLLPIEFDADFSPLRMDADNEKDTTE